LDKDKTSEVENVPSILKLYMMGDIERDFLIRMVFEKMFSHEVVQNVLGSVNVNEKKQFISEGLPGLRSGGAANDLENLNANKFANVSDPASLLSPQLTSLAITQQQIKLLWHVREYFFHQALNGYIVNVYEKHIRKTTLLYRSKVEQQTSSQNPNSTVPASNREQTTPSQAPQNPPQEVSNPTIPVSPTLLSTSTSRSNVSRNWGGDICMTICVYFLHIYIKRERERERKEKREIICLC
jgi:hypothetical protein